MIGSYLTQPEGRQSSRLRHPTENCVNVSLCNLRSSTITIKLRSITNYLSLDIVSIKKSRFHSSSCTPRNTTATLSRESWQTRVPREKRTFKSVEKAKQNSRVDLYGPGHANNATCYACFLADHRLERRQRLRSSYFVGATSTVCIYCILSHRCNGAACQMVDAFVDTLATVDPTTIYGR